MPLRARKKQETRRAIQRAALQLALDGGLENLTIEAIAAAANISQRTFFNYFDSKEDAIVGVRAPRLTEDALETLRESADLGALTRVSRLVTDVVSSTIGPGVDLTRHRWRPGADGRGQVKCHP